MIVYVTNNKEPEPEMMNKRGCNASVSIVTLELEGQVRQKMHSIHAIYCRNIRKRVVFNSLR